MSFFERRVRPRLDDLSDEASSSGSETGTALKGKQDRQRITESKSQSSHPIPKRKTSPIASSRQEAQSDSNQESDSDSDSSTPPEPLSSSTGKPLSRSKNGISKRSSKHAPQVLTTRRPVPRARTVISGITTLKPRDPRFDPGLSQSLSKPSAGVTRHRYAFLNDYVNDELSTLKKASKDNRIGAEDREQAKKAASAIQNRKKQQERLEREEAVVKAHRQEQYRKERESGQGDGGEAGSHPTKKFFLKKGEIKRRVLEEQFKGMSEKQAERTMERKRRRRAGKERRLMPTRRA